MLGHNNILVAKAYEELAYATYVKEYSSGHFEKAKKHAEAALLILHLIIPSNHLLVASAQVQILSDLFFIRPCKM